MPSATSKSTSAAWRRSWPVWRRRCQRRPQPENRRSITCASIAGPGPGRPHPAGSTSPPASRRPGARWSFASVGAAVLAALDGGHQTGQLLLGRRLAGPGLPTVGGIRPAELLRLARDRVPADEDSKLPVARSTLSYGACHRAIEGRL